jgi:predicted phosphodiesterase
MTVRLIVTTGDLSGLGGPVEWTLLSALARWPAPVVFAPGNHDSDLTQRRMRRLGAKVLSEPRLVTVAGVRVWGYPDPNRTVLFGAAHNPGLAREAAEVRPPRGDPYVIAVHSERMVSEIPPGARLVLCGHLHSPEVSVAGDATIVRPGAAGGTNPWSGPVRAAVVDLDLPAHAPLSIWLVEIDGNRCGVDEVAVQPEADPAP